MIKLKTAEDIKIMKEGGKILAKILQRLSQEVKPGITTNHLEKLARELVFSYGVKPSFLGYDGYPAALCTSINEEVVHGVPSERILKDGDVLKLDMGIYHNGFHTDSAVTIIAGNADEKNPAFAQEELWRGKEKLINVTKEALNIGISKAKAGNTIGDIGSAIQKHVESSGLNVVRELVGHGIGRELHEPPQVLNYGNPGEGEKLEVGMVIAIEPMVVTGKWEIKNGKDGFSFVTKDGGLAAHFEYTVAVTDEDPVILTL